MLIIILVTLFIGILVAGILQGNEFLLAFGLTFTVMLGVVSVYVPYLWVSRIASMEAFQQNVVNYEYAVEETSEILTISGAGNTQAIIPIEGSIEKITVGELTADRIVEYRNVVNEYNETLSLNRNWDYNFWVGILVPSAPESLQFITIK